jgi:hypothetical protein
MGKAAGMVCVMIVVVVELLFLMPTRGRGRLKHESGVRSFWTLLCNDDRRLKKTY